MSILTRDGYVDEEDKKYVPMEMKASRTGIATPIKLLDGWR